MFFHFPWVPLSIHCLTIGQLGLTCLVLGACSTGWLRPGWKDACLSPKWCDRQYMRSYSLSTSSYAIALQRLGGLLPPRQGAKSRFSSCSGDALADCSSLFHTGFISKTQIRFIPCISNVPKSYPSQCMDITISHRHSTNGVTQVQLSTPH